MTKLQNLKTASVKGFSSEAERNFRSSWQWNCLIVRGRSSGLHIRLFMVDVEMTMCVWVEVQVEALHIRCRIFSVVLLTNFRSSSQSGAHLCAVWAIC